MISKPVTGMNWKFNKGRLGESLQIVLLNYIPYY